MLRERTTETQNCPLRKLEKAGFSPPPRLPLGLIPEAWLGCVGLEKKLLIIRKLSGCGKRTWLACTANVADYAMFTQLPCTGHMTDHALMT